PTLSTVLLIVFTSFTVHTPYTTLFRSDAEIEQKFRLDNRRRNVSSHSLRNHSLTYRWLCRNPRKRAFTSRASDSCFTSMISPPIRRNFLRASRASRATRFRASSSIFPMGRPIFTGAFARVRQPRSTPRARTSSRAPRLTEAARSRYPSGPGSLPHHTPVRDALPPFYANICSCFGRIFFRRFYI